MVPVTAKTTRNSRPITTKTYFAALYCYARLANKILITHPRLSRKEKFLLFLLICRNLRKNANIIAGYLHHP